jgi:hypothetical protein
VRWRIEQARPEHVPAVAGRMREADKREVRAYRRHAPEEALRFSLARSPVAWTGFVEDEPVAMWGAAGVSLLSAVGSPWLLGTDGLERAGPVFLRLSRPFVRLMQRIYPRLENHVHAGNVLSIRWLKWCGFTLDDVPELFNGEEFYLFWRDADV